MGKMIIESPTFSPLRKIMHPSGDIFHGLRKSDKGYSGFGEAYFTTIHFEEIKGWKKHKKMQMNLIVATGNVRFYIYDDEIGKFEYYELGSKNYGRLTVPPGLWMAFTGLDPGVNLILNIANIEHEPSEATNMPIETFPLPY